MLRLWPFWDGENVTRIQRLLVNVGDLIGDKKVTAWITFNLHLRMWTVKKSLPKNTSLLFNSSEQQQQDNPDMMFQNSWLVHDGIFIMVYLKRTELYIIYSQRYLSHPFYTAK